MEPYTYCKDLRLVWLDGYKIVGNDRHQVVINGEMLQASRPAIDHPQSMSFARSEPKLRQTCVASAGSTICHQSTIKKHFPIDKIIIRKCKPAGGTGTGDLMRY